MKYDIFLSLFDQQNVTMKLDWQNVLFIVVYEPKIRSQHSVIFWWDNVCEISDHVVGILLCLVWYFGTGKGLSNNF